MHEREEHCAKGNGSLEPLALSSPLASRNREQPTWDVRIGMNEPGYASSWRQPVLRALRESNEQTLRELVVAAEQAIILRQRELKNSADHHEERSEMQVAMAALMTINVYKLGRRPFTHSRLATSTAA